MTDGSVNERRERLLELMADERIGQLAPEERAELEALAEAIPDEDGESPEKIGARMDDAIGRVLVAIDRLDDSPGMPEDARRRLTERGARLVGAGGPIAFPDSQQSTPRRRSPVPWLIAAASLVIVVGGGMLAVREIDRREQQLAEARAEAEAEAREAEQADARAHERARLLAQAERRVEDLERARERAVAQVEENRRLLADARGELESMTESHSELETRNLDLVSRLAEATSELEEAELKIAKYEAPQDPAVLAQHREQLLDLSGTFRIEWAPFEVAGLPEAEQPGVKGDVVWNDDLQQGFMRFVGLEVNDPSEEVYQVWVIDERGMEQKVSGGVFNATEDGEIIVPIDPGIDVGNVQVFAVTVEEPGGIWVPDLRRRVVVAPRDEE